MLFGQLSKHRSITTTTQPNRCIAFAKLWVEQADGNNVLFKVSPPPRISLWSVVLTDPSEQLPEHLEAYSRKHEKKLK